MARPQGAPGEESRWIAEARAGDLAAFELLMRRYERLVLVTALRLVGRMEDAQDVSQEVFLKLYRNLRTLERTENLPGWLYRVTLNASRDLRRRRAREAPAEEAGDVAEPGLDPHDSTDRAERRRALDLCLRMLPEREREAVVLRDLEGLSTFETAQATGSTEATVRSHISQARAKMRVFLERYFRRRI